MWNIFKRKEKPSESERNLKLAQSLVFDLNEVFAARREGNYFISGRRKTEETFLAIKTANYSLKVLELAKRFANSQKNQYKKTKSTMVQFEDFVIYGEIVEDYEKTEATISEMIKSKYPEYKYIDMNENSIV